MSNWPYVYAVGPGTGLESKQGFHYNGVAFIWEHEDGRHSVNIHGFDEETWSHVNPETFWATLEAIWLAGPM